MYIISITNKCDVKKSFKLIESLLKLNKKKQESDCNSAFKCNVDDTYRRYSLTLVLA